MKINEGTPYKKATNNELAQYIINLSNELVSAKSHNNKKEVKYLEKDIAEVKAVLQSRKTNEDATLANVNGMGSISMPGIGDGTVGSGDIPHDLGATANDESVKESFLKFNQYINEAASWGVEVEEPFSDKNEKKAQDKFVIKMDPIKVAGSSGFISENESEVNVQLTNGHELYYTWTQSMGNSSEMTITNATHEEHTVDIKTLNDYLGSTGTVVGDMLLIYRNFYFKGRGKGSL